MFYGNIRNQTLNMQMEFHRLRKKIIENLINLFNLLTKII